MTPLPSGSPYTAYVVAASPITAPAAVYYWKANVFIRKGKRGRRWAGAGWVR